MELTKRTIFNPDGDTDLTKRSMIGGNSTGLNDFNNLRYNWTSEWYRQAMNNFWIPEEINLSQDIKDYREVLTEHEKLAYDKVLSFLVFLDSVQTSNLPEVSDYITASEVNRCLNIQNFQEVVHSQSYSYMLDTICSPEERESIIYQWKDDEHLLKRNKYIGDIYNDFQNDHSTHQFLRTCVANYVLEGIYFYSGFMFFYNLGRNNKMPGSVQEIRYINRDENTHLWLFRNILIELKKELPDYFNKETIEEFKALIKEGSEQEMKWGRYVIGNNIDGLSADMVDDYIKYLANMRSTDLGFGVIYPGHETEPDHMKWVNYYSDPNQVKTDFFEGKPSSYSKSGAMVDDL